MVSKKPLMVFCKNMFFRENAKPRSFLHLMLYHVTSFLKTSMKFLKLFRRFSASILTLFWTFVIFFILLMFLDTKKLMTSVYRRWYMISAFFYFQSTLKSLFNINFYWYCASFSWNMKGVGGSHWPPPKKIPSESPVF